MPSAEPTIAPLTEQQVRELAQIRSAGSMMRIACGYLIDGPLDIGHLRTAVATVTRQHTALRTAVVSTEKADAQVVLPEVEPPLLELAGRPRELSVMGMLQFVEQQAGRDLIRLNHGPMWWVAAVRLGPTSHVLVGACSKLVMDFVSIAVMFRWVLSSYLLQGRVAAPTPTTQYLSYAQQQDRWRRSAFDDWLRAWQERVDFLAVVSTRGSFPERKGRPGAHATDMFELPAEAMARARELARERRCELLQVLAAVLACVERDHAGCREHRLIYNCPGRAPNEDRAIGSYQLNGLVAFTSHDSDDFDAVLDKLLQAWNHMTANLGVGVEALMEALAERSESKSIPIPFRWSLHAGEPPPPPEIPPRSNLKIDFLPNLADREAPLDPYTEGSAMFVTGISRDSMMLSWWEDDASAAFYEGLWQTFPCALSRLLSPSKPLPATAS